MTHYSKSVSVIVTILNAERYLSECLASLQKQTFPDFEVIIIDGGSTDRSLAICQEFIRQDPRFLLLKASRNTTLGACRTMALRASKGEFIAILDADDIAVPSRFEKQVHYLREHPEIVLVGSYCGIIDKSGQFIRTLSKIPFTAPEIHWRLTFGNHFATHSTVMFRRDKAININGYRDQTISEDFEFLSRLLTQGQMAIWPEVLSLWRSHSQSMSFIELQRRREDVINIVIESIKRHANIIADSPTTAALLNNPPSPAANEDVFCRAVNLLSQYHEMLIRRYANNTEKTAISRSYFLDLLQLLQKNKTQLWWNKARPHWKKFLSELKLSYHPLTDAKLLYSWKIILKAYLPFNWFIALKRELPGPPDQKGVIKNWKTLPQIAQLIGRKILRLLNRNIETFRITNEWHSLQINGKESRSATKIECVIFSMDRALQLHALLRTYEEFVKSQTPVHVLYRTSNKVHLDAYQEVFDAHRPFVMDPIRQRNTSDFKPLLVQILNKIQSRGIFFLTDDDLFIEPVDLSIFSRFDLTQYVPSFRHGANLTRCHMLQVEQPLPPLKPALENPELLTWSWEEGSLDWGYPLSVNGHIFLTSEILPMVRFLRYNSPNTFENSMQILAPYFTSRSGVSYKKSRLLNLPINKVQSDTSNLAGNIHPDFLLRQWQDGKQLNCRKLYGLHNISVHQELPIEFENRKNA